MADRIDTSPAAIAALDAKLASQIGDDVQVIFNHEYLFKQSRAMLDALAAERDALRAEVARRSEMHECAMAERDDCIEDWSKARAEIERLAAERDALKARAALAASQTAADCHQPELVTAQAGQEPVVWRYRHSETENWHYGPSRQSWWECQPLYAAPPAVTVHEAARVLLADDLVIAKMAEAVHDGPLGADDHWFSAARPQGAWCVDVVRAALRAIGGDA